LHSLYHLSSYVLHDGKSVVRTQIGCISCLPTFEGLSTESSTSKTNSVCMSPACIHASSEILYNLHSNYAGIDPCTNFEQIACGGWQDRHDIRSDQGEIFVGTLMFESSQTLLRHILEGSTSNELSNRNPAIDEANFAKIKNAYDACMDEEGIKKYRSGPLLDFLNEIEDRYHLNTARMNEAVRTALSPSVSQTTLENYDNSLTDAVLFLMDIGVDALLSFGISVCVLRSQPISLALLTFQSQMIGIPTPLSYLSLRLAESGSLPENIITRRTPLVTMLLS
jgi:endothelin-converting enzyme